MEFKACSSTWILNNTEELFRLYDERIEFSFSTVSKKGNRTYIELDKPMYHIPKTYYKKMMASGAVSDIKIVKFDELEEKVITPFIQISREYRGWVLVKIFDDYIQCLDNECRVLYEVHGKKEYEVFPCREELLSVREFEMKYDELLSMLFGEQYNAVKSQKSIDLNVLAEIPVEHRELYRLPNIKNGRRSIQSLSVGLRLKRENVLTYNEVLSVLAKTNKGYHEASEIVISYAKNQGRNTNERFNIGDYNPESLHNSLQMMKDGITNKVNIYYWIPPFTYLEELLTIEYIGNEFIFSYLNNDNQTEKRIIFAKVGTHGLERLDGENLIEIINYLLGYESDSDEYEFYFESLWKEAQSKNSHDDAAEIAHSIIDWGKEHDIVFNIQKDVAQNDSLNNLFDTLQFGLTQLFTLFDTSKYNKIYQITLKKEKSVEGAYHLDSHNITLDVDTFSERTIYHEYGHLIHYSLMNPQVVGDDQALLNKVAIDEFLETTKESNYIKLLRDIETKNLAYYLEPSERFARFVESYVLYKIGDMPLYPERKRLNTIDEIKVFEEFMRLHEFI